MLTSPAIEIPLDGTFLVQLESARPGRRDGDFPSGLTIVSGTRSIPLTLIAIAPGLARAEPASHPAAGSWRLTGAGVGGAREVRFSSRAHTPTAPRAPRVQSVTYRETSPASRRRPAQYSVRARLPDGTTPGIVAVAVLDGSSRGSWMAPQASSLTQSLYPGVGRCQTPPTGRTPLGVGANVTVVVVDAFGRIAASSPIVVSAP